MLSEAPGTLAKEDPTLLPTRPSPANLDQAPNPNPLNLSGALRTPQNRGPTAQCCFLTLSGGHLPSRTILGNTHFTSLLIQLTFYKNNSIFKISNVSVNGKPVSQAIKATSKGGKQNNKILPDNSCLEMVLNPCLLKGALQHLRETFSLRNRLKKELKRE